MMKELAENVDHAVIKGASHWMPEESPEEFTKVVTDWLDGLKL